MRVVDSDSEDEASGVVELDDEVVLFIERNGAATT
jgi:hypothetical protein